MGNKVTSVASAVASTVVAIGSFVVGLAAVVTGGLAAVASTAIGFAIVNTFKERTTKEELLKSGWKKIYYLEETKKWARTTGKFMSVTLTERFATHSNVYRTEICDAAGNFLGSTLLEAIDKVQKLADDYFKKGNFQEAVNCLTEANNNCPNELTNEKIAFRKIINMATSEIHYNEGSKFAKDGNFSAAVKSFEAAFNLHSDESRRQVFLKAQNNAQSQIFYNESQQILTKTCNQREYERAKEYLDQALRLAAPDYINRTTFENSRNSTTAIIERIKNKERAEKLFRESQILWLGACTDEKSKAIEEATRKFNEAHTKLQEAIGIVSNNPEYQRWATICNNKIQGNDLLKKSVNLVHEGSAAFKLQRYGNAKTIYNNAHDLCLKAEEMFTEIQHIQASEESKTWLGCVQDFKESVSKMIKSTTLFVPGEQVQNERNPINRIQHRNIPLVAMRNG